MHNFFYNLISKSKSYNKVKNSAKYISFIHGREKCVKISDNNWLSIKGCGWIFGPPTIYYSKKDPLFFGILEQSSALREYKVSKILNSKFKNLFAKCVEIINYKKIDLEQEFNISLPKNFKPSLLIRRVSSPYRLEDISIIQGRNYAKISFLKKFGKNELSIKNFQKKLLITILKYHSLGCINDSLEWNNVTTHGEIIDLEIFKHPKVKLGKNQNKFNFSDKSRIEKEVIYFLEIIYKLREILGYRKSIKDISLSCINLVPKQFKIMYFSKILYKISKMR